MDKRSLLFTAVALAIACGCNNVLAYEVNADRHVGTGIHEVADQELADMRGRYVVGDNTVLWFGVQMVSTWQTNNGQILQSALSLGLNFSKNANEPQVTFVPTVTITTLSNALPSPSTPSHISRSIQSGGVANVGGLTQSVQIAGDRNAASNVTSLTIQNNGNASHPATAGNAGSITQISPSNSGASSSPASVTVNGPMVNASSSTTNLASAGNSQAPDNPTPSITNPSTTNGDPTPDGRTANVGNASASATYSGNSAQLNLSVAGQGSASQWIRQGSIGQTIALAADNQIVTNQMIVSMVTQSLTTASSQLSRTLAQSLNLSRTNGR